MPNNSPLKPKATRKAKTKANKKIDKAIPKEKKYARQRIQEKKKAEIDKINKGLMKERLERQARAISSPSSSSSSSSSYSWETSSFLLGDKEEPNHKQKDDVSFECLLCLEDIQDIIEKQNDNKRGGIDGGLSLWCCDQRDCGALFCISCAIQYIKPPFPGLMGKSTCPACRRPWDIKIIKNQARAFDPELLLEERG
ncbi:uncharacterized protein L201_001200 [Kwoniella dendrophila CBS 6074]|uniref:RING-type domain-containing protein n=1 Tax=Kwoniella dendrophila CBS 6074 TaxID=1295534 RepID=A0AAX4JLP4_9TREE